MKRGVKEGLRGIAANCVIDEDLWLAWNDGSIPKRERIRRIRSAAREGSAPAASMLGYCFSEGFLLGKSETNAIRWYRRAAQKGEGHAQYNLAQILLERSPDRNRSRAGYWFRRAALQGHLKATTNYAVTLENSGRMGEAIRWYKRSIRMWNDKLARRNLAKLLKYLGRR